MGVTSESDGSLRFWDLEQRRIIRSLDGVGRVVGDSLTLGLDDRMIIVCMGPNLQVGLQQNVILIHGLLEIIEIIFLPYLNEAWKLGYRINSYTV